MLATILVVVILFLLLVIWSQRRIREPHLRLDVSVPIADLVPSVAGLTHGTPIGGNAVELIENGRFFDRLVEDIARAQCSVHFETYLWADGEASRRVVRALAERAAAGVPVRVLVDALGGKDMGDAAQRDLAAAGCRVQIYRQGRLHNIGLQNSRDHRKLMVIDGRIAYIGGHCIKDTWLGDAEGPEHFRDVSARVRGPIVHAAQATFGENWVESTGELFVGDSVFPELAPAGDVEMHWARVKPAGAAPPAVRILYHLAIGLARERVYVQNPYFLPGDDAIAGMAKAVARGVDVRIMTPGAEVSDMPLVQHAAHRNFGKLLAAGVRLFEYRKTLLHQKTITVDGAWCVLGSANFDERSLGINDEVAAGFNNAALARRLEEIFTEDLRHCTEVDARTWAARGLRHRLQDRAVHALKYQL